MNYTPNPIARVFGFFSKIFGFIVVKWKYTLTLLGFLFVFFTSIVASAQQLSPLPFVTEVGSRTVGADNDLYFKSKDILEKGNTLTTTSRWQYLKALVKFVAPLWTTLLLFWVIYLIVRIRNTSQVATNLFIATIVILVLQTLFNFYLLSETPTTYTFNEKAKLVTPCKGIVKFAQALPMLLNPLDTYQNDIDNTQLINVEGG